MISTLTLPSAMCGSSLGICQAWYPQRRTEANRSRKADGGSQRLQLFGVAANGIEQQVVGAHLHELFELLGHLLRGAVKSRRISPGRIPIHDGEPAEELLASHSRVVVHRDKQALGD